MLPECNVLFRQFLFDAGTEAAARAKFQMMVTDLIAVRHPNANEVAGPGGTDWGIDTYVGRLDESVVVWQSKFFTEWTGEDQRGQVRKSFNELIKKAREKKFQISAWTLCIPLVLPPGEQQWFDRWAAKQRRLQNIPNITLWNGTELRRQLMQADAVDVRRQYFSGPVVDTPEPVVTVVDLQDFGTALFVRQLEEAGYVETDAARGLFFAAEALARDFAAKGNTIGIVALQELHLDIQNIWEQNFNSSLPLADQDGRMAGLIERVVKEAAACNDPNGLRLRPAHRSGIVHRLVEDARAGWVRHWRAIAASHDGVSAADVVTIKLASAESSGQT